MSARTSAALLAICAAATAAALASQASMNRAVKPLPRTLPLCEVEDGSRGPVPCRWEASISGNGQGDSFTITVRRDGALVFTYDDGHQEVQP